MVYNSKVPEKLLILIVDDSPEDVELMKRELIAEGLDMDVEHAGSEKELFGVLDRVTPDIVLADHKVSAINALDIIRIVKERLPEVPIIVVTGSTGEEVAVECMKAGAGDYVLKSNLGRLPRAVMNALERKKMTEERDRAFQALRESAELLHRLSDVSFDGVVIHDGKKMIEATPRFAALFGYKMSEVVGMDCVDIIAEESRDDVRAKIGAKYVKPYEAVALRKDGTRFPVELQGTDLFYKGREVRVATVRDISGKKLAEKQLKDKNAFLTDIIESLTHPFYVIDAGTCEVKLSNSAARLLGVKDSYTCYQLTHRRDKPCTGDEDICPLEEVKRTKKPVTVEHVHYDSDGNPKNVEVHAYPIFDDEGNVTQMIEYSLDITERKKMERLKDEFVNTVSHELRNPIAIIKQSLYLLAGKEGDRIAGESIKTMEILKNNVSRLELLVNDILDYQKLTAGMAEFVKERQDLNKLVKQVADEMSPLAGEKGLELAAELAADVPELVFDKVRITQVLMNLLSNAVKFTGAGRIKITVERCGGEVKVSVRDTGIGIRPEDMHLLFQSFTQIRGKEDGRYHGTGLGLVICKNIVEHHGGRIWAESEYGKGSTFSFTLPCLKLP